jgi:hypothetical protein
MGWWRGDFGFGISRRLPESVPHEKAWLENIPGLVNLFEVISLS